MGVGSKSEIPIDAVLKAEIVAAEDEIIVDGLEETERFKERTTGKAGTDLGPAGAVGQAERNLDIDVLEDVSELAVVLRRPGAENALAEICHCERESFFQRKKIIRKWLFRFCKILNVIFAIRILRTEIVSRANTLFVRHA